MLLPQAVVNEHWGRTLRKLFSYQLKVNQSELSMFVLVDVCLQSQLKDHYCIMFFKPEDIQRIIYYIIVIVIIIIISFIFPS